MTNPGLHIDWDSPTPVYRQIAEAVRDAAREGRLESGDRLTPTRDLARQLGVNRNTVVAAYEALAAEGWVESHTGRGTFLASRPHAASAPAPASQKAGYGASIANTKADCSPGAPRNAVPPSSATSYPKRRPKEPGANVVIRSRSRQEPTEWTQT